MADPGVSDDTQIAALKEGSHNGVKNSRFEAIRRRKHAKRKDVKRRMLERQRVAIQESLQSDSVYISKREKMSLLTSKLETAFSSGQRLCIDLSVVDYLSIKEQCKLAGQLGRVWAAQKRCAFPASVFLCGWNPESEFASECTRRNDGFLSYKWHLETAKVCELFAATEIVYLTPNSPNVLKSVDADKVYVIGGLVDETPKALISFNQANSIKCTTARLPIDECLQRRDAGSFKKVLTVNQVFEALLLYLEHRDWTKALSAVVPSRFGFAAPEQPNVADNLQGSQS